MRFKVTNNRLDIHKKTTIIKSKFGDSNIPSNGEGKFKFITREGVKVTGIGKGIQGVFTKTYNDLKGIPPKLAQH